MKLPHMDIPNLPTIHCAICLNLGDYRQRAETVVRGYAVCARHSLLIDEHQTITAALDAARPKQAKGKAV